MTSKLFDELISNDTLFLRLTKLVIYIIRLIQHEYLTLFAADYTTKLWIFLYWKYRYRVDLTVSRVKLKVNAKPSRSDNLSRVVPLKCDYVRRWQMLSVGYTAHNNDLHAPYVARAFKYAFNNIVMQGFNFLRPNVLPSYIGYNKQA